MKSFLLSKKTKIRLFFDDKGIGEGILMNRKLRIIRGDTFAFGVEFKGLDQELDTFYFTCQSIPQKEMIFQKSLGDGISLVELDVEKAIATYRVRVAPEDTANLAPGTYFYDCEIGINNDIFTLMEGELVLRPDATYRSEQ